MKVKNIIATGIVATAGLLMATGAHALPYPMCKSGSIGPTVSTTPGMGLAGAGYVSPTGTFWAGNRYVTLTCDADQIVPGTNTGTNSDNWTGTTPRVFVISATPSFDPDGKYATVLTALALNKKVTFIAQNFGASYPDDATCKTYVNGQCTVGNRIIMSIGILP